MYADLNNDGIETEIEDIKITIDNQAVQDILSRGEQKMLVNAMHLAQARRLSQDLEKYCLLLVDDLPSELDSDKQQLLTMELARLSKVQLFITAIKKKDLNAESFNKKKQTIKVFHVEHANITQIEN